MANYAFLLRSKNAGPPDQNPEDSSAEPDVCLLRAKYSIPALWFTLFDSTSLKSYADPQNETDLQYLVTSKSKAFDRLESSVATFGNFFANAGSYSAQWLDYLRRVDCEYFKADVSEILDMGGKPDDLKNALEFLSEPSPMTIGAFFSLTSLPESIDADSLEVREVSDSGLSTIHRLMGVPACD